MKYLEKIRKHIPFLEDWSWEMKNNGGFCEKHGEFESDMNEQDNEQ